MNRHSRDTGLYRPQFEHDGCGFGMIAHMDGLASHWLVKTAVQSLSNLTHRGAIASDGKTGDGCGILLRIPDGFIRHVAKKEKIELTRKFAVGMVFLNSEPEMAARARSLMEQELKKKGLETVGWRIVPTNSEALGESAQEVCPQIEQIFVNAPNNLSTVQFERRLYATRRTSEKAISESG